MTEAVLHAAGEAGRAEATRALADVLARWQGRLTTAAGTRDGAALARQAEEFAAWLRTRGVGAGAVVIVATGNDAAFLPALVGATLVGACPLPLAPVCAAAVLEAVVGLTDPAALVVPAARAAMLAAQVGGSVAAAGPFENCGVIERPGARLRCAPLAGMAAIASSGTTGLPKVIVHRPQSLLDNARLHAAAVGLGAGDRFLLALPCHFSFGLVAGLLAPLQVHADVVLAEHPISMDSWRAAVERHRISIFSSTPSLLRRLLPAAPFPSSLRTITIGGDEAPVADMRALRERFDGEVYLTYGMSEAGPRVFTRRLPAGHEIGPEALHVGAAFPGIETRLCEPVCEDGVETGELALLTPTAMLGRWDGSRLTREDFDDAWLRTGDLFARNARGELTFSARKKEVIVVGGEKIGAAMIRRVLLEHACVAAARVWAEPHPELGAVPVAAVRYREGADKPSAAGLTRWVASRLRRIEIPRRIDEDPNLPISFK